MSIRCPHCGLANPEEAVRCRECGEPLIQPDEEPQSSDAGEHLEDSATEITPPCTDDSTDDRTIGLRSSLGDLGSGDRIDDRYRIIELLGSGGMGDVYRAEQVEPVRRQVALKVIKLGMDTRQVVARFNSERQALALMEHANIARVFDAGATSSGRPYFVMEYVKGQPITEYCDRHNLSTVERLKLFCTVCDAVQHAHQKGIIHRDLKPSNVLVTVEGDAPVPKIIDFGIAKATGGRLTEETLFTATGQLIGTPEYMSPEQAEMSGLDVDTRTDIYSLGVMLYELLVGALPFDPRELRQAAFGEIRRIIRETDPPRPSTRFSSLGETRKTIARCRRTEPSALARSLCGDLEWLTLRAMEKDRTRRYASASELAADIERHLRHEPIEASPPGKAYRMRKYIRRHRTGVTAAALVVLALVAGIVGTTVGLVRARQAEREAEREAETARQVSDFLVEMFEVSDPAEARGEEITAREVLDRGAEKIDAQLADRPNVRARLMWTIGRVYLKLGLLTESEQLLQESFDIKRDLYGEQHPAIAENLEAIAALRNEQARYEEAEDFLLDALRIKEEALKGTDDKSPLVSPLSKISIACISQGKYGEAEKHLKRSLEISRSVHGMESADVATTLNNLGWLANDLGKLDLAESRFLEALAIWEDTYGEVHPEVRTTLSNLGTTYQENGKLDEAEAVLSRSLDIAEKLYGPVHPAVAVSLHNLGNVYSARRDLGRAETLLRRALEIKEASYGQDHLQVAYELDSLAIVKARQKKLQEARPLFYRALEIREKALGSDHPDVAFSLHNLGSLLADMERYTEAEPLFRRALAIRRDKLGPKHHWVASTLMNLGGVCISLQRFDEAETLLQDAFTTTEEVLGHDHPRVPAVLMLFAQLHQAKGDSKEARSYYERAVSRGGNSLPPKRLAALMRSYSAFLRETGDTERAEEMASRAESILADGE